MANLSAFRASLVNGGVRPNTFEVNLNFPAIVPNASEASRIGTFHCKSASLPDSNIADIPVFFQGRPTYVGGERTFNPWEIAVYNENFLIRDAFERWMDAVNGLSTNEGVLQPALYATDMMVKQLDRNGTVLKEIRLVNAWPIQLAPIQLDFEANNTIQTFPVVIRYDYYESSGVNA